jgi:hypothetical protein
MELIAGFAQAMRGERAALFFFEKVSRDPQLMRDVCSSSLDPYTVFLRFGPSGWVCQNLSLGGRLYQLSLDGVNEKENRVFPARLAQAMEQAEKAFQGFPPYCTLVALAFPYFGKSVEAVAATQTLAHQALIACALEQHRRALGEYPATLAELVPRFIERLPHDVVTGNPLIYRRNGNGKFLLYSVGWNEKDDGGKDSGPSRFGCSDRLDWAWASSTGEE